MDNRDDMIKTVAVYLELLPPCSSFACSKLNFLKQYGGGGKSFSLIYQDGPRAYHQYIHIGELAEQIVDLLITNEFPITYENINKFIVDEI